MNRIGCIIYVGVFFYVLSVNNLGSYTEIDSCFFPRYFDYENRLENLGKRDNGFDSPFITDDVFDKDQNFVVISLGCNCQAALIMRFYNLRTFAFPFDWCLTPFEALFNFLEHDFADYFRKENLITSSKLFFTDNLKDLLKRENLMSYSEHSDCVLDKKNGMIFNHDFPDNTQDNIDLYYEPQYAKYQRRIKRFYDEINSGKHIYFIRYRHITKNEALDLYQLIKSKFPMVNFTLVVIGDNEKVFTQSWEIPHIKNFYFYSPIGVLNSLFWKELCHSISAGNLQ